MAVKLKSQSRISKPVSTPAKKSLSRESHDFSTRQILATFSTPIGWIGLSGQGGELTSVYVGHASSGSIRARAVVDADVLEEGDWNPALRSLFEAYADGEVVSFDSIEIRLPEMTAFRRQIVEATRNIGYGQTVSYGELALQAGHPGAARAVGTVMSSNRFPILIPCHRVLAAGGKLGGYTSPAGIQLKQTLLEMEARCVS
jgi:methylated-DNA-[protein]-cysteine S-methyltransferase